MNKISIITVTYNRSLQMYRGLRTILNQAINSQEYEILVIDDGSTDDTKAKVEKLSNEFPQKNGPSFGIKYIYLNHPEPRISCIPRNVGIKQATGDIIIFTEPEALHIGNTIEQLLQKMKEYPENTILASQVWTIQEKIAKQLREDEYLHPEKILQHPYAQLTDTKNPYNIKAPDSDWAITGELHCNAGILFATRKQWLMDIGGFDESFEGHGNDDFDLFNRLAMIGHGIIKDPDIAVIHAWHEKNYPYNIYEMAEKNGKISERNIHAGIYRVNEGNPHWGELS